MEAKATFEATTKIWNGYHSGWQGETRRSEVGKDWVISTLKRSSGHIVSVAQAVQDEGGGSVSYMVFGSNKDCVELLRVQAKATEKAIRENHFKALAIFDAKVSSGELGDAKAKYEIKVGQVFFTEFQREKVNRRAVCEILPRGRYKTVLLDGTDFKHDDHVRDFTEVFGIGVYYHQGDVISENEVNELVITAHENVRQREVLEAAKKQIAGDHKAAMIAKGAEVLPAFPAGVQAVIIGVLRVNDSDPMTDYFGSHTEKTVYLAFSAHKKNLFPEMRKAAANCADTKFLQESPADCENKENYTGGGGYYLGEHRHSGWQVSKCTYGFENMLESIQIAIGEGRCFIPFDEPKEESNAETSLEGVQVVDYSEKSVAVIGDTYPIRAMLKEQGGRFNKFLKVGGNTVAGWIFPKSNPPKLA